MYDASSPERPRRGAGGRRPPPPGEKTTRERTPGGAPPPAPHLADATSTPRPATRNFDRTVLVRATEPDRDVANGVERPPVAAAAVLVATAVGRNASGSIQKSGRGESRARMAPPATVPATRVTATTATWRSPPATPVSDSSRRTSV